MYRNHEHGSLEDASNHGGEGQEAESTESEGLQWPAWRKWMVFGVSCLLTFLAGPTVRWLSLSLGAFFNSSAPTTAFPQISDEFGISNNGFEYSFFMVSSWNVAAGVFPMISLSLMDTYGTYRIYLISLAMLIIFVLPQALAPNFGTLIVVRFFAGAFGGTLQNGSEAVLANLFHDHGERVLAATLYILALIAGVTLGPVQGALVHVLNWRWIFWTQMIAYGAMLPVSMLLLHETRAPVIPVQRRDINASMEHSTPAKTEIIETIFRSARLLTTEFIVFSFMLWCAFSYGLIFISTESVAVVYEGSFSFETYSAGIVQVSMFIGEVLGAIACTCFQRWYIMPSSTVSEKQNKLKCQTNGSKTDLEKELYLSIPATIIGLSGGLFVYGWTADQDLPWVTPAIGLALQGFAVQVILTGTTIYLTECYGIYAASAIAGIAIGENVFAAFLPLASVPMYEKLDFSWASTLLACIGLILVVPPIALILQGSKIRSRSFSIQELCK